jgi:hypothetical protein
MVAVGGDSGSIRDGDFLFDVEMPGAMLELMFHFQSCMNGLILCNH